MDGDDYSTKVESAARIDGSPKFYVDCISVEETLAYNQDSMR
jgi:hypothetical protein